MKKLFWAFCIVLTLAILFGTSAYIISVFSLPAFLEILKGGGVLALTILLVAITKKKVFNLLAIGSGYFFYTGLSIGCNLMAANISSPNYGAMALVKTMPYVATPILVIGCFIWIWSLTQNDESRVTE